MTADIQPAGPPRDQELEELRVSVDADPAYVGEFYYGMRGGVVAEWQYSARNPRSTDDGYFLVWGADIGGNVLGRLHPGLLDAATGYRAWRIDPARPDRPQWYGHLLDAVDALIGPGRL